MGMDLANIDVALMDLYGPMVREYLFLTDEFLRMLEALGMDTGGGLDQKTGRGKGVRWFLHYTGNSSVEIFTENQVAPTPGQQVETEAYLGWVYAWAWLKLSKQARDALEGAAYFDKLTREMTIAQEQIRDLRNTTYMGTTTPGLLFAISNTGTYATINRAVSTWFQSYVDGNSGVARALTVGLVDDMLDALPETPYNGRPSAILTGATQRRNYARSAGLVGAANAAPRIILPQDGGAPNYDLGTGSISHDGIPIFSPQSFSNANLVALDFRSGNIHHRTIRPFESTWHHNEGDHSVHYISTGGTITVEQINWQGKITDLSS